MSATDSNSPQEQPANAGCGAAPCSSSDEPDFYDYDYDDDERCHFCGGDGCVGGDELGDPGWYLPGELYKCTCCGGSGKGSDCTFW